MRLIAPLLALIVSNVAASSTSPPPMPEFTHSRAADWLNSPPLTWSALRGKVVLVEFWTFDCVNCRGSIAWLHSIEQKFSGKDFVIVGVHTPELPQEYERGRLVAKLREYQLTNPQMIDNDYSYWNAVGNQYWPAFYVVDRSGRAHALFAGETHIGEPQAQHVEETIRSLLRSE